MRGLVVLSAGSKGGLRGSRDTLGKAVCCRLRCLKLQAMQAAFAPASRLWSQHPQKGLHARLP